MKKKSILFIHPFLPFPLESGGHQALFNGIRAIIDDYDVTLIFEGDDTPEMQENICSFLTIMPDVKLRPLLHKIDASTLSFKEKVYVRFRQWYHTFLSLAKRILGVRTPKSEKDISSYWTSTITPSSKTWIEHIYKISRERHYDIIQIEMPWRVSDIFAMPRNTKIIYVHHELGFVRRGLEIGNDNNPYFSTRKAFADFNEMGQLNMYDAVITLSCVDKDKLLDNGLRVPVFSSFAVVGANEEIKYSDQDCKRLTFVGIGSHSPNRVGLIWFLENCWEKLRSIDGSYTLDVIGKWSNELSQALMAKYSGLTFLGFVPNLYEALENSIMIVPITVGSGIRMKILEAGGNGVPFVSTKVGAEGLPFVDGDSCFITDDPDTFVDDIVRLNDVGLRNAFIEKAYNIIKSDYSLEALGSNRRSIYEQILGS